MTDFDRSNLDLEFTCFPKSTMRLTAASRASSEKTLRTGSFTCNWHTREAELTGSFG